MKLKRMLSGAMVALMLAGSTVAVSADATVYTAKDLAATTCYTPCAIHSVQYNKGYPCGAWCYYDGSYYLEANWNPYIGRYENNYWNTPGYYWVNGVPYCYDTHVQVVPTTTTTTTTTVNYAQVDSAVDTEEAKPVKEGGIPNTVIKKKPNVATSSAADDTYKPNVIIGSNGTVSIKNPALLGSVYSCITVPGTYYAYDKVDLNKFFSANTYTMWMNIGEYQTMDAGFKMVTTDSSVVRIYNDTKGNQLLKAEGAGNAYVYLYTGGGVPFMRLNVNVSAVTPSQKGYIDVKPATWRLDGKGSSTEVVVSTDKDYGSVKLVVEQGNAYIKTEDGKNILTATGDGPVVIKAYSTANTNIAGYAVLYVGKYVDALYDGYWTSNNGSISCNYWNPYLWNYDGYKINGWVVTDTGAYLPVIDRVGTYYSKPTGTVVNVYNDLYDMLYDDCKGDYNTFYNLLWYKYNQTKPTQSFDSLYGEVLADILEDISDAYSLQYLPWIKK